MKTFQHTTEAVNAVDLLPVNGNSSNSFRLAEAIYPTRNHSVVGLNLFKAPDGSPYTNHAVVVGKTGYGKSVTNIDLAMQLQPHVQTTVIIESGKSWLGYVLTFGDQANSLSIDPNGSDVLNYLDTAGLPLSPQHLKDVIGVQMRMIGFSAHEDVNKLRAAKLRNYLLRFHKEHFAAWQATHQDGFNQIRSEFGKLLEFSKRKKLISKSLSDRFSAFRDWAQKHPEEYQNLETPPLDFDPRSESEFFRFAYAYLTPEEAPTHSQFHDWLHEELSSNKNIHDEILLSNLGNWRADSGENGKLFDGVSTFQFDGPIVHIELGMIPDTDKDLKRLAGFIVSNYVRNKITRMPRSAKKLIIFEELGNFLTYEDAKHIISDFYERGRKLQACILTIVQQLSRIPKTLQSCILNNASLGMFFRQEGLENAQAVQEGFRLPEATALELTRLPRPTRESGARFICWQIGHEGPVIHEAYNLATPEMLYIAESSGNHFEEREKTLANYDDVLEGIRIEARKRFK